MVTWARFAVVAWTCNRDLFSKPQHKCAKKFHRRPVVQGWQHLVQVWVNSFINMLCCSQLVWCLKQSSGSNSYITLHNTSQCWWYLSLSHSGRVRAATKLQQIHMTNGNNSFNSPDKAILMSIFHDKPDKFEKDHQNCCLPVDPNMYPKNSLRCLLNRMF